MRDLPLKSLLFSDSKDTKNLKIQVVKVLLCHHVRWD